MIELQGSLQVQAKFHLSLVAPLSLQDHGKMVVKTTSGRQGMTTIDAVPVQITRHAAASLVYNSTDYLPDHCLKHSPAPTGTARL